LHNVFCFQARPSTSKSQPARKPSVGDLIRLDKTPPEEEDGDEVIFDPLEEAERKKKLVPQPPSTSTLPQLAASVAGQRHPPVKRTSVKDFVNQINNGNNSNPFRPNSSDDLLKSYGLDFAKMSVAGHHQERREDDPFQSLDPLAKPSAPPRAKKTSQQGWTTFE